MLLSNPRIKRAAAQQLRTRGGLFPDLSLYPFVWSSADPSIKHTFFEGIILDCSPVKATNIKKLGFYANIKTSFVKINVCRLVHFFTRFWANHFFFFGPFFCQNECFFPDISKITKINTIVQTVIFVKSGFLFMYPKSVKNCI